MVIYIRDSEAPLCISSQLMPMVEAICLQNLHLLGMCAASKSAHLAQPLTVCVLVSCSIDCVLMRSVCRQHARHSLWMVLVAQARRFCNELCLLMRVPKGKWLLLLQAQL